MSARFFVWACACVCICVWCAACAEWFVYVCVRLCLPVCKCPHLPLCWNVFCVLVVCWYSLPGNAWVHSRSFIYTSPRVTRTPQVLLLTATLLLPTRTSTQWFCGSETQYLRVWRHGFSLSMSCTTGCACATASALSHVRAPCAITVCAAVWCVFAVLCVGPRGWAGNLLPVELLTVP